VSITIVDDDEGGMLMFELPTKEVSGTVCVCVCLAQLVKQLDGSALKNRIFVLNVVEALSLNRCAAGCTY
jgi:type III secretory pathway component EscS